MIPAPLGRARPRVLGLLALVSAASACRIEDVTYEHRYCSAEEPCHEGYRCNERSGVCEAESQCGPANCRGCCSGDMCQPGLTSPECGKDGEACQSCAAPMVCTNQVCAGPADPCQGVTCSGHGKCTASGTSATCTCDPGYHPNGLACEADANPCQGVTCSGHGKCTVSGTSATCTCDQSYRPSGLTCIESCPLQGITDGFDDNVLDSSWKPGAGFAGEESGGTLSVASGYLLLGSDSWTDVTVEVEAWLLNSSQRASCSFKLLVFGGKTEVTISAPDTFGHRFKLATKGTKVTFYLDGVQKSQATAEPNSSGLVGLEVSVPAGSGNAVVFDYFKVTCTP